MFQIPNELYPKTLTTRKNSMEYKNKTNRNEKGKKYSRICAIEEDDEDGW